MPAACRADGGAGGGGLPGGHEEVGGQVGRWAGGQVGSEISPQWRRLLRLACRTLCMRRSAIGSSCHASAAFRHSATTPRRYILLHLQRAWPLGPSQPCPHPDLILWCLTLPAMWGEADKARVREAAKRAGEGASHEARGRKGQRGSGHWLRQGLLLASSHPHLCTVRRMSRP